MHPDDVPIFWQSIDLIAKTGEPIKNAEFRGLRRDGAVRWMSTTTAGLYDGDGKLTGFMGITRDVTEKKLADEERRNLQEELVQAQKMESIGRLAGGVAHDFNNILMGIQGNTSLMLMEHSPEHPHYQRLSRIEEHVQRGAKLTRQLLGFARGGKYEVKTLAINDLIRKSAGFFIETRKEIEAFFELQEDLDPVDADAGQMEQVLLNIFINAGHAMPKGGQLHIRTANVFLEEPDAGVFDARPGSYIKISISDTGIGMDKETLERVFEPFFTTKSQEGGSGLGLASAYGIVRNHGGIIHAYSEPGRGTTLTIYLPSSEKTVDGEVHAPPKGPISGKGVILIIDDEPLILDSTKDLLEMLGYTVYCAASGQEGTAFYMEKKDRIDLVILDMILPGMSGSQVLRMLKANNPGVRVILSSGYSLQGEVQKVMDDGCVGFIQKPFNLAELSTIVHQALHPAGG
jgi:signal transduction histidine kinase